MAAGACLTVLVAAGAQAGAVVSGPLSEKQISAGTGEMRASGPGTRGSLGVATLNAYVGLPVAEARADARRLTDRPGVDVVGWQEANNLPAVYAGLSLRGWSTAQPTRPDGRAYELAVSWRTAKFTLVSSTLTKMHDTSTSKAGQDTPFPARYVQTVVLERIGTYPDRVTVLNTHVNQRIERWSQRRPGVPYVNVNTTMARRHLAQLEQLVTSSTTRYTVLVGDLNWDYAADQRTRRPQLVEGRLGPWAVSGWKALGVGGYAASHPGSRRNIDYVFVTRSSPAGFTRQAVLAGYHSDHRPVVAWLALS